MAGSICAAHPVTMILAAGFSRAAFRTWRRDSATASFVTAHVLIITAGP